MKQVSIIAAMTSDRVIGRGDEIPWHIRDDLRLFKQITTGNIVVMGRNTWESIPVASRPLPGRTNIIISTTMQAQQGVIVCRGIPAALSEAEKHIGDVFCVGGSQLYAEMIGIAETMHISWVKKAYEGDKVFPEIDPKIWNIMATSDYPEFTYIKYVRRH